MCVLCSQHSYSHTQWLPHPTMAHIVSITHHDSDIRLRRRIILAKYSPTVSTNTYHVIWPVRGILQIQYILLTYYLVSGLCLHRFVY